MSYDEFSVECGYCKCYNIDTSKCMCDNCLKEKVAELKKKLGVVKHTIGTNKYALSYKETLGIIDEEMGK